MQKGLTMWIKWKHYKEIPPKENEFVMVLEFSDNPTLCTPETVDPTICIGRWVGGGYDNFLDMNDQIIDSHYWYPLPKD